MFRRVIVAKPTMAPFKSILVDVDATARAHPALERAVLLAQRVGATLTVADVVTIPPPARHYLPPALEEDLVSVRRQQLARVANAVRGVPASSRLLVGRPATALIQEVLRSNHDLLVRSHARDLAVPGAKPFGVVDMELLRLCPCPVLLARHGSPTSRPRIAAAVNASTEEAEEQALNAKIVEFALMMAAQLDAEPPTLLQAWTPFAERMIRGHAGDDQLASYVDGARQHAAADLARLVRSLRGACDGRASHAAPWRARRHHSRVRRGRRRRLDGDGHGSAFRPRRAAHREHGRAGAQKAALFGSDGETRWIRQPYLPRSVLSVTRRDTVGAVSRPPTHRVLPPLPVPGPGRSQAGAGPGCRAGRRP